MTEYEFEKYVLGKPDEVPNKKLPYSYDLKEELDECINVYGEFKKSQKPKVLKIMKKYGLEHNQDYTYNFQYDCWGNRELVFTIWWPFHFFENYKEQTEQVCMEIIINQG